VSHWQGGGQDDNGQIREDAREEGRVWCEASMGKHGEQRGSLRGPRNRHGGHEPEMRETFFNTDSHMALDDGGGWTG